MKNRNYNGVATSLKAKLLFLKTKREKNIRLIVYSVTPQPGIYYSVVQIFFTVCNKTPESVRKLQTSREGFFSSSD